MESPESVVSVMKRIGKSRHLIGRTKEECVILLSREFGDAEFLAMGGNAMAWSVGKRQKYVLKLAYRETSTPCCPDPRITRTSRTEFDFMRELRRASKEMEHMVDFRVLRDPDGVMLELMPRYSHTLRSWTRVEGTHLSRDLSLQAVDGLVELHHRCIVHGDIKPENMMLRVPIDPSQAPTLLYADFGASCHSRDWERGNSCTSTYAPPEVFERAREEQSGRAHIEFEWGPGGLEGDVWALGLLSYFAATGKDLLPTCPGNVLELMRAQRDALASDSVVQFTRDPNFVIETSIFQQAVQAVETRPSAQDIQKANHTLIHPK